MTDKSIEIYYDISEVPGITNGSPSISKALDFRNAAMEHIEQALLDAGLGEWSGAEIGSGEVNFGFVVTDFDLAEQTVRQAVAGTRFSNIREIERYEFSTEDYDNDVGAEINSKPLGVWGILSVLLFRRVPKRFRGTE
ncbi:hypothetical protein [Ruegeria sp.]|uniref:hypothetical protein n=1 Tax=Ruegeria sp. TaxID=1879320 RepID=UPI003B591E07